MSQAQRPLAITVIAWGFVVVGAAGLLKDWWPLVTSGAAQVAKLKAEGLADFGPAWVTRVLGIIGGVWLLRGHNWARWLLVAWMAFHIGRSIFHSWVEVLMHTVIFLPVLYFLFRGPSARYFEHPSEAA